MSASEWAESRLNSLIHATETSYSYSLENEAICRPKSIALRWDKILRKLCSVDPELDEEQRIFRK